MKRLVAIVLLAALTPVPTLHAADPQPGAAVPTSPSVPTPVLDKSGMVIPASGVARVQPQIRERVAGTVPRLANTSTAMPLPAMPLPTGYHQPTASTMPLPTGYQQPTAPTTPEPPANSYATGGANGCATGGCAPAGCDTAKTRGGCFDCFKAWLCFRPTTGDALRKFRPAPYVGPITGTFPCTSANGCGTASNCATGNGCAAADTSRTGGSGRLGGLLSGRGCRGECVPPSNDTFPGYHFAEIRTPGVTAPVALPPAQPVAPPAGYLPASQPLPPVPAPPREPQSRTAPVAGPTIMPAAAVQVVPPSGTTNPSSVRWASFPGR